MMPLSVSFLQRIIPVAVQSFLAAMWQGTILVIGVSAALRFLRGISAAARSIVWLAVLILLVALSFFDMQTPVSAGSHRIAYFEIDIRWAWLIFIVWSMLSLFRMTQLVRSAKHVRRVCSRAVMLTPAQCQLIQPLELKACSPRFTNICLSSDVDVPCVVGFFFPRILIPPELFMTLSSEDARLIVEHELAHLHRRDDWINLLQKVGLVLLPLSPGLWWVERCLCMERELACDDRVLLQTGTPRAYARCLANLAERSLTRRGLSLMLGAWNRRSALANRIHRILQAPKASWSPMASSASVFLLMCAVIGGAGALGRKTSLIDFRSPDKVKVIGEGSHRSTPLLFGTPMEARAFPDIISEAEHRSLRKARTQVVSGRISPMPDHPEMIDASVAIVPKPAKHAAHRTFVEWRRPSTASLQTVLLQDELHYAFAAIPTSEGLLIFQL